MTDPAPPLLAPPTDHAETKTEPTKPAPAPAAKAKPAPAPAPTRPRARRPRAGEPTKADLEGRVAYAERYAQHLDGIVKDVEDIARDALWREEMIDPRTIREILTRPEPD